MLSSIRTTVRLQSGWGSLVPGNNPNTPGAVPDHDNDGVHDANDPNHPSQPPSGEASCQDAAAGAVLDGTAYSCAEALAELGEMGGCDFPLIDWPRSAAPVGMLLRELCPTTCGNTECSGTDTRPHPAHISFISSGLCETTDGCSRITDEETCRWVGTAAVMTFAAGNGHFRMGAGQQPSAAPGCVYSEGNHRLK